MKAMIFFKGKTCNSHFHEVAKPAFCSFPLYLRCLNNLSILVKRERAETKIMYKLDKDLGVYYIRAIIQIGFRKNFCLISHCNQVSMGITVNAWNRQPLITSTVSMMASIRLQTF